MAGNPDGCHSERRQSRSRRIFPDIEGFSDAAVELARHTEDADPSAAADEIQRVLFSTAAIAQYMNLDAEELLTRRTDRFISDLTKEEAEGDCADWDDCRREEAAERAFDKKN